jgi:hypothetical protein
MAAAYLPFRNPWNRNRPASVAQRAGTRDLPFRKSLRNARSRTRVPIRVPVQSRPWGLSASTLPRPSPRLRPRLHHQTIPRPATRRAQRGGHPDERIWADKKTGATVERDGPMPGPATRSWCTPSTGSAATCARCSTSGTTWPSGASGCGPGRPAAHQHRRCGSGPRRLPAAGPVRRDGTRPGDLGRVDE